MNKTTTTAPSCKNNKGSFEVMCVWILTRPISSGLYLRRTSLSTSPHPRNWAIVSRHLPRICWHLPKNTHTHTQASPGSTRSSQSPSSASPSPLSHCLLTVVVKVRKKYEHVWDGEMERRRAGEGKETGEGDLRCSIAELWARLWQRSPVVTPIKIYRI